MKLKKFLEKFTVLRRFTQMENNCFTTKIFDIIIPKNGTFNHLFLILEHMPADLKKILN